MLTALCIDTCRQREAMPFPIRSDASTAGDPLHIRRHRHRHRAHRVGIAQRVVIHHMIGVVAIGAGGELAQHAAERFFKAQAQAIAAKLRTIHAATGIARLAIANPGGDFQQCVCIRCPTQRRIGIPFLPCRRHARTVAIGIVARLRAIGAHPRIARGCTGSDIEQLIIATKTSAQHTGLCTQPGFVEARGFTLKAHRARRCSRPPQHRLRAFDHGQAVVGFRGDIGQRVVHPRRASAGHAAVVAQQVEARTEHAAQHRVAIAAAIAYGGKAGNGFEVVGTITGRHRLARQLGVGFEGQRLRGCADDHHAIEILGGPIHAIGTGEDGEQADGKRTGKRAARRPRRRET